MPPTQPTAHF